MRRALFSISTQGTFRTPVIVVGRWALKFARNTQGRRCNRYEADLYRSVSENRRRMLCPVIWVSRRGKLLIMAAATPLTEIFQLRAVHGVVSRVGLFVRRRLQMPVRAQAIGLGLVWRPSRRARLFNAGVGARLAPAIFVQLSLAADGGALRRVGGVAFGVGLPARRKMPGPLV